MAEVKWIKIVTDIFDNRKIKQIEIMPDGDTILVIWFKLICLAGSINDNGLIYLTSEIPYTEEMLAAQFGRSLPIVRLALRTFESFGMIEVVDNFLCLPSWEKYQSAEKLAHMRSKNAERQARFRERKRAELAEKTVTPALPVTPSNTIDIEEDKEIEREEEKKDKKKAASGKPEQLPTIDFGSLSPTMISEIEKWLQYKKERKETYKPTGLKALIAEIQNNVSRYGEQAVIDLIHKCMAANWRGIIFDKLKQPTMPPQYQGNRGSTGFQTSNPFMEMRDERRGQG